MSETLVDQKCQELAEHFLPDATAIKVRLLAVAIQNAIEDFFHASLLPSDMDI